MKNKLASATLCIFLFLFQSTYSIDWPLLKKYDQEHTCKIALPIGRIGTDTFSLDGRGNIQDWEIINKPANSLGGIYEELLSLSRIDFLPQYRDNSLVHQISSYDTTGGNDDGFSGKYSFLRIENNNLVIADLKGSGVIQRIWTPTPTEDTIQFYFDGENSPRISIKFIDLFTGDKYPFLRPIVGNEVGGYYCYLPIPYQKSCKIVYKGKRMQFIQIQYRQNTDQNSIVSFPKKFSEKDADALALAIKTWSSYGKAVIDLSQSDSSGIKSKTSTIRLKSGEVTTLFKDNNGGRIIGFELIPQSDLSSGFKDLLLRATWDDEKVAAINCPLTDFFGYAFGKPSMQSMLIGVNDKLHYCYLPMPYEKNANLELVFLKNEQNVSKEISFKVKIYYNDVKKRTDEGRLYTKWRREIDPEHGKPYTILEAKGHGHYVGTILQAQGLNSGITLFFEGDDMCLIDGELRLHGTGSEDYFNGGWYALADRWDQAYNLPVHGALAYSIPLARTGGYRFYISDKISFKESFQLTIEHGPHGNDIPVDYTSIAFYYCDQPPVENNTPSARLLSGINPPSTLEYWLALLPIKAFSDRATISHERWTDSKTKVSYNVLRFSASENGFVKFELEVPSEGEYKLYMSYFKGPNCSAFQVNQRQIPIKKFITGYSKEDTFIEKEYIGKLYIKEGTNTITVILKENSGQAIDKNFILYRIYLEKL